MPVIIKVGKKANQKKVRLELDLRRSMSGDLMIFDHGDIDIVLSPTKKKVVVFPKETMTDLVYGAQTDYSLTYESCLLYTSPSPRD